MDCDDASDLEDDDDAELDDDDAELKDDAELEDDVDDLEDDPEFTKETERAGKRADSASGAAGVGNAWLSKEAKLASSLSRIFATAPEMASIGSRKVSASALMEAATSCRAVAVG